MCISVFLFSFVLFVFFLCSALYISLARICVMDHCGECGGVSGSEKKISGIVEDESKNVGDDICEILPRRSNITHLKSVARKKSKSPSSVARKTSKSPSTVKQTKDSCASGSKDAIDDSHETKHVVVCVYFFKYNNKKLFICLCFCYCVSHSVDSVCFIFLWLCIWFLVVL